MGLHFGELPTKVRGIIYYSLSPYEQRAYAGTLKKGIPNTFRRFRGSVLKVVPPFILAYLYYDWNMQVNRKLMRKGGEGAH